MLKSYQLLGADAFTTEYPAIKKFPVKLIAGLILGEGIDSINNHYKYNDRNPVA
jgi:hypothetical protein